MPQGRGRDLGFWWQGAAQTIRPRARRECRVRGAIKEAARGQGRARLLHEKLRGLRALGATACTALGTVQPEEMGHCDFVETKQLGGRSVTVFRQESDNGKVASIILRSATKNVLDDLERTVNDGINTVKTLCKDRRLLPGAGATDIALAQRLKKYGNTKTGLEQYAIRKFGEALEVCPRTLGENRSKSVV